MRILETTVALSALLLLSACGQSGGSSGSGLTGSTRTAFVDAAVNSCSSKQRMDPANASVDPAAITTFCTCYANGMADKISPDELQSINNAAAADPAKAQAMLQGRIDDASAACRH